MTWRCCKVLVLSVWCSYKHKDKAGNIEHNKNVENVGGGRRKCKQEDEHEPFTFSLSSLLLIILHCRLRPPMATIAVTYHERLSHSVPYYLLRLVLMFCVFLLVDRRGVTATAARLAEGR